MSVRVSASAIASLSLLAAWTSIAVFVAAVITPAAFAVLPTRALAGALVGRTLPVLFALGIALGAGIAVVNQGMDAGRAVTAGATVLAVACGAALIVEQRLRAMLAALGAPMDSIPSSDPRRIAFGRLHGVSVLLLVVAVLGASVAYALIARGLSTRSTP